MFCYILIQQDFKKNKLIYNNKIYDIINYNKGVSILYKQLPFTLKFALLYPIISNSKAA